MSGNKGLQGRGVQQTGSRGQLPDKQPRVFVDPTDLRQVVEHIGLKMVKCPLLRWLMELDAGFSCLIGAVNRQPN
ncbi:hypothetical protein Btru_028529 [Bulinus truncatus]|nr:hypothetical protein Btru_028529 [Bulinus truncatus]